MSSVTFMQIFSPYLSAGAVSAAVAEAGVEDMRIDKSRGRLTARLDFNTFVDIQALEAAETAVSQGLAACMPLSAVEFAPSYPPECLTPDSFAQAMAKCRQVAWAIGRDM